MSKLSVVGVGAATAATAFVGVPQLSRHCVPCPESLSRFIDSFMQAVPCPAGCPAREGFERPHQHCDVRCSLLVLRSTGNSSSGLGLASLGLGLSALGLASRPATRRDSRSFQRLKSQTSAAGVPSSAALTMPPRLRDSWMSMGQGCQVLNLIIQIGCCGHPGHKLHPHLGIEDMDAF